MSGARIPVDVEREDRLLAGLSARQLGILGGAAVVAWVAGVAIRTVLPAVGALAAAWLVLLVGLGLALGRRDGLSLDRLVLAAWRQRRAPRWMVPAPEGVRPAPAFLADGYVAGVLPAPLELPVVGVSQEGVLDLGACGAAVLCRASGVAFSLRTWLPGGTCWAARSWSSSASLPPGRRPARCSGAVPSRPLCCWQGRG
jgi:hypothetical protein